MVDLLTEAEAAERLRCKLSTVKRLRLTGKLPYLPHRPPMIDAADVEAYIEREKRRGAERVATPPAAREIDADGIRQRARTKALRRRFRAPTLTR